MAIVVIADVAFSSKVNAVPEVKTGASFTSLIVRTVSSSVALPAGSVAMIVAVYSDLVSKSGAVINLR